MRKILNAMLVSSAISAFASEPPAATTAPVAPKPPRVEPVITAVASLPMPERKTAGRGSTSPYPFDSLTSVGQAFGVKNKTARELSSIVSNQNRKHKASGPDGKSTQTRKFAAFDVTDTYRAANKDAFAKGGDFEGAKALVFRVDPA